MTFKTQVYVAGVGSSPSPAGSSASAFIAPLISAATKALLDAGITFDDVSRSVTSASSSGHNYGSQAADAFDEGLGAVEEVENGSEFASSFYMIRDRGVQCVLVIAAEKVCL